MKRQQKKNVVDPMTLTAVMHRLVGSGGRRNHHGNVSALCVKRNVVSIEALFRNFARSRGMYIYIYICLPIDINVIVEVRACRY